MQTELTMLPPADEMYDALVRRDTDYDGIFVTAVTSTGIFCRPSCPAKKPLRENVEFYATSREALFAGYRPCRRCRPLEPAGSAPGWLRPLLEAVDSAPGERWSDEELRTRGFEPERVRRWFKSQYGMTFHAYQRGVRLGRALGQIRDGAPVTRTAFDSGYESLSGFQDAFQQIVGRTPTDSRGAEPVVLARILTPLGPMVAGATDEGLCILEFSDRRMLEAQFRRLGKQFAGPIVPGRNGMLDRIEDELTGYFEGRRTRFEIPLVVPGSEFQQLVWQGLRDIPYGETRSYAEQSIAIGRPEAVRAVARANGDNRIAIVIPCHRVIGSDGKLTGYGGGLWRKRWLLEHERKHVRNGSRVA